MIYLVSFGMMLWYHMGPGYWVVFVTVCFFDAILASNGKD